MGLTINVSVYEFQYGLLVLRKKEGESMSNLAVEEEYGSGKGPLLSVTHGEKMDYNDFRRLEDFREQ